MEEWHNTAEKLMRALSASHAISGMLKNGIGVNAYIDGIQTWFHMNNQQAASVQQQIGSIAPEQHIVFDHEPISISETRWITDILAKYMQPQGSFHIKLSHLAIVNSIDQLTTTNSDAFATLLVPLQSVVVGGKLAIGYKGSMLNYTPTDNSFVAFYNQSTIEMAPIIHGRLCMLVYDVVYNTPRPLTDEVPIANVPNLLPDMLQCFEAEEDGFTTVGHRVWGKYDELSIEKLQSPDRNAVCALVASGCFDVAIVKAVLSDKGCYPRFEGENGDIAISDEEVDVSSVLSDLPTQNDGFIPRFIDDLNGNANHVYYERDDGENELVNERIAQLFGDSEHDPNEVEESEARVSQNSDGNYSGDELESEDFIDDQEDLSIFRLREVLCIPECQVPTEVLNSLFNKPINLLISVPVASAIDKQEITCLVFWSKKYRLRFLGFRKVMTLLTSTLHGGGDPFDLHCNSSLADMTRMSFAFFHGEHSLANIFDVANPAQMIDFLYELEDVDLICKFISDYLVVDQVGLVDDISSQLLNLVRKYGWEKLYVPLLAYFGRHNSLASLANAYRCLMSLMKEDRVVVRQRNICEGLKAWHHALLDRYINPERLHESPRIVEYLRIVFSSAIIVESCIDREMSDTFVGSYLGHRLPYNIVNYIESYLCQTTLDQVLSTSNTQLSVYRSLVSAIAFDVTRNGVSISLKSYKSSLLSSYFSFFQHLNSEEIFSMLVMAHNTNFFSKMLNYPLPFEASLEMLDGLSRFVGFSHITLSASDQEQIYNQAFHLVGKLLTAPELGRNLLDPYRTVCSMINIGVLLNRQDDISKVVQWLDTEFDQHKLVHNYMIPKLPQLLEDLEKEYDAKLLPWKYQLAEVIVKIAQHCLSGVRVPETSHLALATKLLHCDCRRCTNIKIFMENPSQFELLCSQRLICYHFMAFDGFERALNLAFEFMDNGDILITKCESNNAQKFQILTQALQKMNALLSGQPHLKRRRIKT